MQGGDTIVSLENLENSRHADLKRPHIFQNSWATASIHHPDSACTRSIKTQHRVAALWR